MGLFQHDKMSSEEKGVSGEQDAVSCKRTVSLPVPKVTFCFSIAAAIASASVSSSSSYLFLCFASACDSGHEVGLFERVVCILALKMLFPFLFLYWVICKYFSFSFSTFLFG